MELSLSTESCKTIHKFQLFYDLNVIHKENLNLDLSIPTSRPILKSKKTTPNSAIAFVACTLRIIERPYGPIKMPAVRYPRTGLPKYAQLDGKQTIR